ncbi:hypothetical protein [Thermaurantiacus sp.]
MATEDDIEWWEHADLGAMASEVAADVAFLLAQAVEGHGHAVIAVPPSAAMSPLVAALFRTAGPWKQVTVIPTHGELAAESAVAAQAAGARVAALDGAAIGSGPIDLALLEVAETGRVGGILPGPKLADALASPHPVQTTADGCRFLTGSALLGARALILSVQGAAQRAMLEDAIADGPGSRFPAGRLLAEADQAIDIHWCP